MPVGICYGVTVPGKSARRMVERGFDQRWEIAMRSKAILGDALITGPL
jgi:hypothetical protein